MRATILAAVLALFLAPAAAAAGPTLLIGATEDAPRSPSMTVAKAQMDLLVAAVDSARTRALIEFVSRRYRYVVLDVPRSDVSTLDAPGGPTHITTSAPIPNEFSPQRSNVRGTMAMAKLNGDPNSATSAPNSARINTHNSIEPS